MSTAMDPRTKKNRPQAFNSSSAKNSNVRASTEPVLVSKEVRGTQALNQYSNTESSLRVQRIVMTITVVMPFLGLLTGIALAWQFGMFNAWYLAMMIGGWVLTGLGITIGYHRMLTHRSFETYSLIHGFWTLMGALAI